jgi:putative ABC transport system permease protein
VWQALKTTPGLAVVDVAAVPRREQFAGAGDPGEAFALEGFYFEDGTFDPVPIEVRDPQTGKTARLTVIGVLTETAPLAMAGISASQSTLSATFGHRVEPTVHLFALRDGVDAGATAEALEASFLASGFEADALDELLADTVAANVTFNRLVQGFMGLGLIVGVAALGVISARSVVERRQQIGVLRAIGFRKRMVQLAFVLESSFIALTSIVIGTLLGLLVSLNIIVDSQEEPSWSNLHFDVPWLNLGVIFLAVYLVALAAAFLPALRASRVYPAEALRYQ